VTMYEVPFPPGKVRKNRESADATGAQGVASTANANARRAVRRSRPRCSTPRQRPSGYLVTCDLPAAPAPEERLLQQLRAAPTLTGCRKGMARADLLSACDEHGQVLRG